MKDAYGNWIINTPDDACGIDMSEVRIVFYSVPRSAGTMIFQLLREMFPDGGIVWGHQFIPAPEHVWTTLSYRDFRDCAVSHWRYRFSKTHAMTPSFARVLAGWYLQHAWTLSQHKQRTPVSCFFRYESHRGDPWTVYRTLRDRCPLANPHPAPDGFVDNLCLKQQRLMADSGVSDLMSPGHVGSGEIGQYRDVLDDECTDIMNTILGDHLREYGYQ